MTSYYLTARVDGYLLPLVVVPTGKREDGKLECICITPNTCGKVWISREDLVIE